MSELSQQNQAFLPANITNNLCEILEGLTYTHIHTVYTHRQRDGDKSTQTHPALCDHFLFQLNGHSQHLGPQGSHLYGRPHKAYRESGRYSKQTRWSFSPVWSERPNFKGKNLGLNSTRFDVVPWSPSPWSQAETVNGLAKLGSPRLSP